MKAGSNVVSLTSARAIKAALLHTREPYEEGSDEFVMEYRAHNGRSFEVREYPFDGRFFLSEARPTAKLARYDESRDALRYIEDPRLEGIMDDPNAFIANARHMGIDVEEIVRTGAGIGRGTIFHGSLDEVAETVATALDANLWYDHVDHAKLADPAFQARMKRLDDEQSAAYRAEKQAMHDAAVEDEHGLFKGLHAMTGPLSDGTKKEILSYLNDPTEEGWNRIHGKIIKGFSTVWQAWLAVDRAAPMSKPADGHWPSIPDPETLRAALRKASGVDLEEGHDGTVVPMTFRR